MEKPLKEYFLKGKNSLKKMLVEIIEDNTERNIRGISEKKWKNFSFIFPESFLDESFEKNQKVSN